MARLPCKRSGEMWPFCADATWFVMLVVAHVVTAAATTACPPGTPARPFIFFHLQKTAGTTMKGLLRDGFSGPHFVTCSAGIICNCAVGVQPMSCGRAMPQGIPALSDSQLAGLRVLVERAGLFAGHFAPYALLRDLAHASRNSTSASSQDCETRALWGDLTDDADLRSHLSRETCLTILRNPLERLISHYGYFTRQRKGSQFEGVAMRDALTKYGAGAVFAATDGNLQSKMLSAGCCGADETHTRPIQYRDVASKRDVSHAEMQAAMRFLDVCNVGFVDDMESAMASLPAQIHVSRAFASTRHFNARTNATRHTNSVGTLSPADHEALMRLLAPDFALYYYAKATRRKVPATISHALFGVKLARLAANGTGPPRGS